MKFFLLLIASVLIITEAAVENPDAVLAKIETLKSTVFGKQSEAVTQLTTFRQTVADQNTAFATKTLELVRTSVQQIDVSDNAARSALAVEVPNACTLNLENFFVQIMELSGYGISNCIKSDSTTDSSESLSVLFESIDKQVNGLGEIIIMALTGRNIFTQGDEIVARADELLKLETGGLTEALAALAAQLETLKATRATAVESMGGCYLDITDGVNSAVLAVMGQLPMCKLFNTRGSRSAFPSLPSPESFFRQK